MESDEKGIMADNDIKRNYVKMYHEYDILPILRCLNAGSQQTDS